MANPRLYKNGKGEIKTFADESYELLGGSKSGYVLMTPSEIAALPPGYTPPPPTYVPPNSGGAVTSVNGKTGDVVIATSGGTSGAPTPVHLSRITQFARKKTVRLLYTGTSLANNANSGAKNFVASLTAAVGDSGNRTETFGYLGGGYTDPVNGWKKQRYGGFSLIRMRGESTSTTLSFSRYFKRYVLRYSTETTGGSFDLFIDGVKNQTINCNGAQQYGLEAVVTFATAGQHLVEIKAPASGFAFIETQDFCVDLPGIHLLDASLGGSALAQMVNVGAAGGNQIASIAIGGSNGGFASNGVDAVYNNTRPNSAPDAILFSYTVNDAGAGLGIVNGVYKTALDYLVKKTYENNQQLIIILEMGGHYSLPSYPTNSAFLAARDLQLSYVGWPHVTLFDWHTQSGMNTTDYTELVRLGNRYYPVTGLTLSNAQNNTGWGGDFIHPNDEGNAILAEMMLSRFGIAPQSRQGDQIETILDSLQPRTEMTSLSGSTPYAEVNKKLRGITRRELNALGLPGQFHNAGYSTNIASGRTETVYQNNQEINFAVEPNTLIAAANTSDQYGAYRVFDGSSPMATNLPSHELGGKMTLTFIVGSGNIALQVRNDQNTSFLPLSVQGATATGQAFNITNQQAVPQLMHVTIDNVPGVVYVVFTGKLYGVLMTATAFPVLTTKRVDQVPYILPSVLLTTDIDAGKVRPGQSYYEQVNGKSIEKIATDGVVIKPLSAGNKLFGLYRLRDKSSCENQLFRLNGTKTFSAYNEKTGGMTQVSSDNPQVFAAPVGFTNASAGKTYTVVGTSDFVKIQLYNGGANVYLGLTTAGVFNNNGGNDGAAPNLMTVNSMQGRPAAFTFTMPAAGVFNGLEWELRVYVEFNKQQPGFWHICEGNLATI